MKRDAVEKILEQKKIKVTEKRTAILLALSGEKKPISAPLLLKKIIKKVSMDEVTLYRNLSLLSFSGLIKELNIRKGVSLYEIERGDHHHHITCTSCGDIEDIGGCTAEDLSKKALAESKYFTKITHHSYELFGVCKSCSK